MIPKEYFNNGLFLGELEGITSDSNDLYFQVAEELFSKDSIEEKILLTVIAVGFLVEVIYHSVKNLF